MLPTQTAPVPSDPAEVRRVAHTRLRRRLLYSEHEQDLIDLMARQLGNVRREAWGRPDLTANPYLSLWDQASRLYAEEPAVEHPEAAGLELLDRVADAGLWPLMQRVQRDTLALREMVLRVDVVGDGLVFRPVFPDLVEARATARRPGVPHTLAEWSHLDGFGWVRLEASIDASPYYRATTRDGVDVSEDVLGGAYEGDSYPVRDAAGAPVLPYVIHHAAVSGWLWDPFALREIVEGSLNLGLYLSFFGHILLRASWPQRYAAGVVIQGRRAETEGGAASAREEVTTDPAMLLTMAVAEDAGQPIVGQWGPAADPEVVFRAVAQYERRLLLMAGLAPPDVTRQQADIRSGYSLAVHRESVREQQRLYEPIFREADLATIRLAAVLLNSTTGTAYPEGGYSITYRGLAPSPVEDAAKREHVLAMLDRGVVTVEEARAALAPLIARL